MLTIASQTLTPITGKVSNTKMNTDQEDGFPHWRWWSEPSGEMPPSTGMDLFPFSKEEAKMYNEVWSISTMGTQKPKVGKTILSLCSLFRSPTQNIPISSFFCLYKLSAVAIGIVGDTQNPYFRVWKVYPLCSYRLVPHFYSKEKLKSLSSKLFPNSSLLSVILPGDYGRRGLAFIWGWSHQ